MRLYGRRFWGAVGLGIPPTLLGVLLALLTARDVQRTARLFAFVVLFALIGSLCLIVANRIASDRPQSGSSWVALAAGVLVFLPLPVLVAIFYLPGLIWFAFLGFAVPAAMFESRGLGGAFRRTIQLARADYAQARGAAAFIAVLLLSPLLFLAAALLYEDQVARLEEH